MQKQQILIKNYHKIDGRQRCLDPGPGSCFFPGSGSGLEKIMDTDPVCPERLDPNPDPINIRPDPKPWQ